MRDFETTQIDQRTTDHFKVEKTSWWKRGGKGQKTRENRSQRKRTASKVRPSSNAAKQHARQTHFAGFLFCTKPAPWELDANEFRTRFDRTQTSRWSTTFNQRCCNLSNYNLLFTFIDIQNTNPAKELVTAYLEFFFKNPATFASFVCDYAHFSVLAKIWALENRASIYARMWPRQQRPVPFRKFEGEATQQRLEALQVAFGYMKRSATFLEEVTNEDS